jgi:hypothetical protein
MTKKLISRFRVLDEDEFEEKEVKVYADFEEGYIHFKIGKEELTFDWDSIEKLGLKLKKWRTLH